MLSLWSAPSQEAGADIVKKIFAHCISPDNSDSVEVIFKWLMICHFLHPNTEVRVILSYLLLIPKKELLICCRHFKMDLYFPLRYLPRSSTKFCLAVFQIQKKLVLYSPNGSLMWHFIQCLPILSITAFSFLQLNWVFRLLFV